MTNDFRPSYFRAASEFVAEAAKIPIDDFGPEDKHILLLGWAGVYATLATVPDSVIANVRVEELEKDIQHRMMRDKLREVAVKGDLQGAAHEAVTNELRGEDDASVAFAAPHLEVVK